MSNKIVLLILIFVILNIPLNVINAPISSSNHYSLSAYVFDSAEGKGEAEGKRISGVMGENTDGKWGYDTERIWEPGFLPFSGAYQENWHQIWMLY